MQIDHSDQDLLNDVFIENSQGQIILKTRTWPSPDLVSDHNST